MLPRREALVTGGLAGGIDRRLLRALELHAMDAPWDEIARSTLSPNDPAPLYGSPAAAEAAVTAELDRLRGELASLRVSGIEPTDDLATVLAQLRVHQLLDDEAVEILLLRRHAGENPR